MDDSDVPDEKNFEYDEETMELVLPSGIGCIVTACSSVIHYSYFDKIVYQQLCTATCCSVFSANSLFHKAGICVSNNTVKALVPLLTVLFNKGLWLQLSISELDVSLVHTASVFFFFF